MFSNTFSPIGSNGGIQSIFHRLGKIGDSDSVFDDYDVDKLMKVLNSTQVNWVGTHCHPKLIDVSKFSKVIIVTTTTYRSKLYRWTRAYHLYYEKTEIWRPLSGLDLIDKARETAKNYLKSYVPMFQDNVINLEFAEVVEETAEFRQVTRECDIDKHMTRWKNINSFLYGDFWNSDPVKRFHEAELEMNLNTTYKYV
jgi:hypothetical protein